MSVERQKIHCLNCDEGEDTMPLISIRYLGEQIWICPRCLPTLIHAPQKLEGKLRNAGRIKPADHNH